MITFELEGEKQLIRKFRGIRMAGRNWLPTMKLIGRDLTGVFSGAVFSTEGREIGEPWKKRQKPQPWPLLNKTGALKGGFKYNAKQLSVDIFNIKDYFVYHQSNKPRSTKLPRRIMMKLDNKRKANVMRRFQETMRKKMWLT